jgi:hypothetical protein
VAAPTGLNSSLLDNAGGGYVGVEYLFIQFAGDPAAQCRPDHRRDDLAN